MGFIHDTLCVHCARNPDKTIQYTWLASLALVAISFICACVAASKISTEGSNTAIGFAGVYTVLLMILLSVGGTFVLRKYKTPLAVGFFLGVVLMMSQQCLIIFAVFAGRAGVTTLSSEIGADNAVAFFCFVLFMVYGFFAGVLAFFRNDLMKATDAYNSNAGGIPVGF
ncbi:unnamed protein product [Heterosigma akashiwo]|uniref:Uncharacterized protein n=1 Tax=Heterosigma akashiwo TaxID=2829 RepID=A0A6V1N1N4_HETAK|mmetsp:Transcript_19863/g.27356  ORF Transcript_19863/g.27356 Transcript_19863/m.27356 type:complete len:169 (+) Transcript_19863:71-577(+)|eukprot:CAMPEP_0194568648 /NCGR_PEP_ID=MMETSP0292-20121207/6690_1 /TAXON_ID=39354 /ORGANISM="Heterosigma akashiwo, Strain CCMP2393" /LENGTH=168 /DNA_ID=CAMNT_0039418761 /DNA_START=283 /DNA_END=789 /DNA_ORIENTATION=-